MTRDELIKKLEQDIGEFVCDDMHDFVHYRTDDLADFIQSNFIPKEDVERDYVKKEKEE